MHNWKSESDLFQWDCKQAYNVIEFPKMCYIFSVHFNFKGHDRSIEK